LLLVSDRPDDRRRSDPWAHVTPVVLGLGANVTVITALLIYFGWRRNETQAHLLGIDEGILGLSTKDYLLQSVKPVVTLLLYLATAALVALVLDRWITKSLDSGESRRPADRVGHRAGTILLHTPGLVWAALPAAVAAVAVVWPEALRALPPAIALAAVTAAYGVVLEDRRRDLPERGSLIAVGAITGLLVGVCLFWSTSDYAVADGERMAQKVIEGVDRLPGVIVSARHPMNLEGPGVDEERLATGEGDVSYRYTGLRLWESTGDNFFLLSDGWTPSYGTVFMVHIDDSVRLDFIRDDRPTG
jgi:hypothetical protein